ncbi:hypothetical protein RRG08_043149 [Elysia crispata]|uniref:Uncharacterized protein n=1 Tax=Elysia crispata TaxID=231223 RepID=A0AAE0XS05_9GAST|nr:hypothetical protein RRG08_043149 [Elysia crispata]
MFLKVYHLVVQLALVILLLVVLHALVFSVPVFVLFSPGLPSCRPTGPYDLASRGPSCSSLFGACFCFVFSGSQTSGSVLAQKAETAQ